MKKIRESLSAKAIASVLLLVFMFLAAYVAQQGLWASQYLDVEDWRDSSRCYSQMRNRVDQVQTYLDYGLQLEIDPDMSYSDRMSYQHNMENIMLNVDREHTNFRFAVLSQDGSEELYSNVEEGETLEQLVPSVQYRSIFLHLGDGYRVIIGEDGEGILVEKTDGRNTTSPETDAQEETQAIELVVKYGVVDSETMAADEFAATKTDFLNNTDTNLSQIIITAAACLVVVGLCFIFILWAGGYRQGSDGPIATWQEKIFLEPYLLVAGAALFALVLLFGYEYGSGFVSLRRNEQDNDMLSMFFVVWSLWAAVVAGVFTMLMRTIVVRIKCRSFWKSSLIARVCRWVWQAVGITIQSLPMIWRALIGFSVYMVVTMLAIGGISNYDGWGVMLFLLINILMLLGLCWWVVSFRRLRDGSEAIAAGNLNHQIDATRFPPDLKAHAKSLNNISGGLAGAVDEKMKSERFKAELITNVSHDLKTPLTSIINYVNLLKTTEQADTKAAEYIDVLDRKSQRLKKLTEDLVEASKASTGTLNVSREKLGMGQLISQALGEYEEKLETRHLSVVINQPEGETYVYADGRHLWRVIDNLLSNCVKYAMENTRIYLDLNRGHGAVTLTVKNISQDPLNVSADRLMERFVRGEEARTTEGSGLGLSIARSLTELQGGEFQLSVDGDLFKATVSLPQAS